MDLGDNEAIMNLYIKRYRKKIYALAYYLAGNDKNKAYEITTASFVKGFTTTSYVDNEEAFLVVLTRTVILQSKQAKENSNYEEPTFINIPPMKVKILLILNEVLQDLPFEEKILLLLRDQMHFSYSIIASVFKLGQSDVRSQITQARKGIRVKLEKALL